MSQNLQPYLEFCSALNELLSDESFLSENAQTRDFLDAMQAWLTDTKGGKPFFDDFSETAITWGDLLKLVRAAAIYE